MADRMIYPLLVRKFQRVTAPPHSHGFFEPMPLFLPKDVSHIPKENEQPAPTRRRHSDSNSFAVLTRHVRGKFGISQTFQHMTRIC